MPEIFASSQPKVSLLDLSRIQNQAQNIAKKHDLLSPIVHTSEHVIRIYTNLTRKESEACGE